MKTGAHLAVTMLIALGQSASGRVSFW